MPEVDDISSILVEIDSESIIKPVVSDEDSVILHEIDGESGILPTVSDESDTQ